MGGASGCGLSILAGPCPCSGELWWERGRERGREGGRGGREGREGGGGERERGREGQGKEGGLVPQQVYVCISKTLLVY